MVSTSLAYKNEQLQPFREKSFMYVYLGIINQEARANATISNGLTPYSNVDSAFRRKKKDGINVAEYATLEDYFTRVDDYNAFLPRNSSVYDENQGIVSAGMFGIIRITFGSFNDVSIKGLTIDFGDEYPLAFSIANDSVEYDYEMEKPGLFQCEDQFDHSSFLEIRPTEMFYGQQRLRIRSLDFGVGLSFENEQLISTQRRNTVSHISDTLPLKQFDFTLINLSRKFSQDNPWSFAQYIQQGQEVEFNYGRELIDSEGNSSIYIIPGGKTYIKTWSSTDLQAKFSTVGKMDLMDSDYYKGTLDTTGNRTAYDVAVSVLEDAGIYNTAYETNYRIDSYLQLIPMRNPLPIATHKACLQMIANCTRSVLYEDRYGKIVIESSFIPDAEDIVTTFTNSEPYSDETSLLADTYTVNYATLEDSYTRVDDRMFFIPRQHSQPLTDASYVSNNGGGSITVFFGAQWTFYNIGLEFSENLPARADIEYYSNDVKLGEFSIVEFELETTINREFENVDKVKITFVCDSNIRIHLNTLSFVAYSGYTLSNVDLMQMPTATSIEHVKEVDVNYYSYSLGNEIKQLTSTDIDFRTNIIKLSNPASNYRLLWDDNTQEWSSSSSYAVGSYVRYQGYKYLCTTATTPGIVPTNTSYWSYQPTTGATITASGAYYVEINVTDKKTSKILIYGAQMLVNYATYVDYLHDIGPVKKLNNVLLQSERDAKNTADWLSEHFDNDTEYTIQYRGEPALDCDDLIYLQNQFVDENLCRIVEEEISTSVGMSLTNSMKLRRVSYARYRDAVVGYAIVDLDRVAREPKLEG